MIRIIPVALIILALTGCVSAPRSTNFSDPFGFNFEPIAISDQHDGVYFLNLGSSLLEGKGYAVSVNEVFLGAITEPVPIGKHRWRSNNDKWELAYQVAFQVIESKNGYVFWRITHKITGTRSGKQPRAFSPSDFDETESIFNSLQSELSSFFRIQA